MGKASGLLFLILRVACSLASKDEGSGGARVFSFLILRRACRPVSKDARHGTAGRGGGIF